MARPPEGDVAWGNMLSQHHGKPVTEGFVRGFFGPMSSAAEALDSLRSALDLDQATGGRLDAIGTIVGVSREVPNGTYLAYFGFASQPAGRGFGQARMRRRGDPVAQTYTMPDAEYRSVIRTKIALNNGHGTATEIADALRAAFKTPTVSVRDQAPGVARCWIGRVPTANEIIATVIPSLLPRLGGVRLEFLFYDADRVFGFRGQPGVAGFGAGIMTRTAQTSISPF